MDSHTNISSSFRCADDKPYVFKNKQQASKAIKKLNLDNIIGDDADEIVEKMVTKKRKIYNDMKPNKKAKHQSTPLASSSNKIENVDIQSSSKSNNQDSLESDIDWSDDGEFFMNVSKIQDHSPVSSPNSKLVRSDMKNQILISLDQEHDSGALTGDDIDWSDCDIDINTSLALLDRSALQEISNVSSKDQLESSS